MTDRPEAQPCRRSKPEFARAWEHPGHTRYQLPDTDINQVLAARYTTAEPLAR